MKLSDFVAEYLEQNGVGICFMVSGGAELHVLYNKRIKNISFDQLIEYSFSF